LEVLQLSSDGVVSLSHAVVYVLCSVSDTLPHNLQATRTCCRCLHSRRSRTLHSDLIHSRTSSVEPSRRTYLPPSPAEHTCLQQRNDKNMMINFIEESVHKSTRYCHRWAQIHGYVGNLLTLNYRVILLNVEH